MLNKKFTTFMLIILTILLSFQSYTLISLQNKLWEAKIGLGCWGGNTPAINVTGKGDWVPDMIWGC